MQLDLWFPTLILAGDLPNCEDHNKNLVDRAYELKEKHDDPNATNWGCKTWNSLGLNPLTDDDGAGDNSVKWLVSSSTSAVYELGAQYGVDLKKYTPRCLDFWFNIAGPNHHQEYHNHPDCHFSVVYYAKATEKQGWLQFKSLETFSGSMTPPLVDDENMPQTAATEASYIPNSGMIVAFRSNLNHQVLYNDTEEDRISIAMNFRMDYKG